MTSPEQKENDEKLGQCLELAAQAWCEPDTSDLVMCPALATAFANILLKDRNRRSTDSKDC